MSVSFGAQAGIKLVPRVKLLELDFSPLSLKLMSTTDQWKKGKYSFSQTIMDEGFSDGKTSIEGVEVENSVGVSFAGIGGSIGQSQKIDRSLASNEYKKIYKANESYKGLGTTIIGEKLKYSGTYTEKVVQEYSFGAKLLVGFEIKVSTERTK